jgi:anhydro-N-acetylmuramic acid kinase
MATSARQFVGLCSGEAADGIDAVRVEIRGRGERMKVLQLQHAHAPYEPGLRKRILAASSDRMPRSSDLAELDRDVSLAFAGAAQAVWPKVDSNSAPVAGIGISGQPVRRVFARSGKHASALLRTGSGAVVAEQRSTPVVSGFFAGDVALGGLGNSAHAWPDWRLLSDKRLSRVVIRLGGIARLTFLPTGAPSADVVAFDVGPGTVLIDSLAQELLGTAFDVDGARASKGRVNMALLNELLAEPFLRRESPKATEYLQWGSAYVWRVLRMAERVSCDGDDLLATATELVARSIAEAVGTLTERPHEVILSGGGAANIHLAGRVRTHLCPSSTYTTQRYGFALRAYGAACFAMLAAGRMNSFPAHCPAASGARKKGVLGGVFLP